MSESAAAPSKRPWVFWVVLALIAAIVVGGAVLASRMMGGTGSSIPVGEFRQVKLSAGSDDVQANLAVTKVVEADQEWASDFVFGEVPDDSVVMVTGYEWEPVDGESDGDPTEAAAMSAWLLMLDDGTEVREAPFNGRGCEELGFEGCVTHVVPTDATVAEVRLTGLEGARMRDMSAAWTLN